MSNYASIDIGSNSLLLHIAKLENQKLNTIYDEANIAGLGKNIDKTKMFCQESMDAAYNILLRYKKTLNEFNVEAQNVYITATEASRAVENAAEFFNKIKSELNFEVRIITGQEEAYYASLGAVSNLAIPAGVLLDIGGASSELIKFQNHPFSLQSFISLPLGSVRATDWRSSGDIKEKFENIFSNKNIGAFESKEVIAIAGTATSLAAMILNLPEYQDELVEGKILEAKKIFDFCDNLSRMKLDEIQKKYEFLGKRSSVIVGGAAVLETFVRELKIDRVVISTRGLRHGVLIKKVLQND